MTFSATEAYLQQGGVWQSLVDNHTVLGSTPPGNRVFGDPGAGNLYWGQTNLVGNGSSTHQPRETYYGKRVGVNRDYFDNGTYSQAVDAIAADLAQGRVPWKSFKLSSPSIAWADFATGTGNSAFQAFLANVDAIGKGPVMVTIHHEPNSTTSTAQDAADHLAMYQRAKTFTDAYPQILLTPCMLAGYDLVNRLGFKFAPWCQGSDGVVAYDVCAFDSYNRQSFNLDGSTTPIVEGFANGKKNLSVQQVVGIQSAQILAMDPTKPWAVGEYGIRTNPNTPGSAAQWMQDLFDFSRNSGCFALSYFDSGTNVHDHGSPWFLDDRDTERLDKFKSILTVNAHSAFIPPGGLVAP